MNCIQFLICLQAFSLGCAEKVARKKDELQPYSVGLRFLGPGPLTVDGKIQFAENLDVELETSGKTERLPLKRRAVDGVDNEKSALYENDRIILKEDCPSGRNDSCVKYGLVKDGNKVTYVNSHGNVLLLPEIRRGKSFKYKDHSTGTVLEDLSEFYFMIKNETSNLRARRVRKADKQLPRVIRILMFADKALIERFLPANGQRMDAAKRDIERFLTLLCNSMTMTYMSLETYEKSLYVKGKPLLMKIAIVLAGVQFPTSADFSWIQKNSNHGHLYSESQRQEKGEPIFHGAVQDFTEYLKKNADKYDAIGYDYAFSITGLTTMVTEYDLGRKNKDTHFFHGFAWPRSLCRKSYRAEGRHSAVIGYNGAIVRTASHELGHAFGMLHDFIDVRCPPERYVMSEFYEAPNSPDENWFYRFSECSAVFVQWYTRNIDKTDFIPTCLQPADTSFYDEFCKGFVDGTTFDQQCSQHFGNGSTRVKHPISKVERQLNKGYVQNCVMEDNLFRNPFWCKSPTDPKTFYVIPEVASGTRCVYENKLSPQNVCYRGECLRRNMACKLRSV